jgi:hypothetical protein
VGNLALTFGQEQRLMVVLNRVLRKKVRGGGTAGENYI